MYLLPLAGTSPPFTPGPFGGGIQTLVMLGFVVVGALFLYKLVTGAATAANNASSPVLSRSARVVAKRQHVWGHEHTRTNYYVTFEFEDGHREELELKPGEFGILAEGDHGTLHSQGTWFKGFDRVKEAST